MSLNEFTSSELVEFKGSKKGIIVNIKRKATFDEIKSSFLNDINAIRYNSDRRRINNDDIVFQF